jgi:hypothetical protein
MQSVMVERQQDKMQPKFMHYRLSDSRTGIRAIIMEKRDGATMEHGTRAKSRVVYSGIRNAEFSILKIPKPTLSSPRARDDRLEP